MRFPVGTTTVDQELLARNEYLAAENRILKTQLKGRPKFSDAERATLGEIGAPASVLFGKRVGRRFALALRCLVGGNIGVRLVFIGFRLLAFLIAFLCLRHGDPPD